MIRRRDRIDLLKSKLDSFRFEQKSYSDTVLFIEAMDNIETEINDQLRKFVKV
jgi:hypothetical protein